VNEILKVREHSHLKRLTMAVATIDRVVKDLMEKFTGQRSERDTEREMARKEKVNWKVTREANQTGDWEYKVVTKGWRLSLKERKQRKVLARICCFARTLERVYNEDTRKGKQPMITWEWMPDVVSAIKGLIDLRTFDRRKETTDIATPNNENNQVVSATTKRKEQRPIPMEDESRKGLFNLWMEFAYSERIKIGWYDRMPSLGKGKCRCGKGRISYPHWPPTSVEEAAEQFELCQDDNNEHRRNLVVHWWRHFNDFASIKEWKVSEKQQRYRDAEKTIRESSEVIQQELERSTNVRKKRPKGWNCCEYCEPVLKEKKCSCLCHCEDHRDECPIHS
jgi:hypothetical protein